MVIAKNYLTKDELASMSRIVNAYLDLAELRAEEHALTEFEKYRVKQDKLYQSDFDKILMGEVVDNEIDDMCSNSDIEPL